MVASTRRYLAISELLIDLLREIDEAEAEEATEVESTSHNRGCNELSAQTPTIPPAVAEQATDQRRFLTPASSGVGGKQRTGDAAMPSDDGESAVHVNEQVEYTPLLMMGGTPGEDMSLSELVGRVSAQKQLLEKLYARHRAQRRSVSPEFQPRVDSLLARSKLDSDGLS